MPPFQWPPSPQRRPYDAPGPGRWLIALVVLLVVLWTAQALYHVVQDARREYLGDGLQRQRP